MPRKPLISFGLAEDKQFMDQGYPCLGKILTKTSYRIYNSGLMILC